jgi:hypothetical protein
MNILRRLLGKKIVIQSYNDTFFKLGVNRMVELGTSVPYIAKRSEIQKALTGSAGIQYTWKLPYPAVQSWSFFASVTRGDNFIKIGCMLFQGENFEQLKKWAGVKGGNHE